MSRGRIMSKEEKAKLKQQQTATGKKGMVVTAHPLATDIGEQVLRQGGNAVDAATAIQFALNVAEPMMTGIGGSGFLAVYHKESEEIKIFNGHTRAPKKAHPKMFLDEKGEVIPFKLRSTNASAVGIPGILKAIDVALEEYGSMALEDLLQPSVEAAENGIPINWVLHDALTKFQERLGEEAKAFYFPEGKRLKEGDLLKKEKLAHTFRILQKQGIAAFYEGEIAAAIVSTVKEHGGFMELADLREYEAIVDHPVWGDYRGYSIACASPPTAGGVTMLQILKILEHFNLSAYKPRDSEKYYLFLEAMRLAFADKIAYSGDPEFYDLPAAELLHDDYIKERMKHIDFKRRNNNILYGNPWGVADGHGLTPVIQPDDGLRSETTHFTVVDQWGNIAACTSTVEHPFGSGIMLKDYGFMLNNELTDFDAMPGGINEPESWKRPVSCKCPTFIFKDGKPVLTLGSPGGPTIIASVFQTIVHYIDHQMSLKEAIEQPRVFTATGPLAEWEAGMNMQAKGNLEGMGFQFADKPSSIGNVQAIAIHPETGELTGAADSSRDGKAAGI